MLTRLQSRKKRDTLSQPNPECKGKTKLAIFEDKTLNVINSEVYSRRSLPLARDRDGCHKVNKSASKTESIARQGLSLRHRNKSRKLDQTFFTENPPLEIHTDAEVNMEPANRDDCTSPVAMETESTISLESSKPSIPENVLDIDACPDSLSTSIYSKDIMEYLMEKESRNLLMPGFLDNSPGVTSRMRAVLMDWLLQVQMFEELHDETLHLCVTFIDNFLSVVDVKMSTLQLIGITCLFLASKFNERFAPKIDSLCYLTQNTFVKEQVLQCERIVLQTLHFNLACPVSVTFLDRYLQVHQNPPKVEHEVAKKLVCMSARSLVSDQHPAEVEYLARYLLDLHITSISLASTPPSMKASSALYLARFILLDASSAWTPDLVYYTNYTVEDLQDCTSELINLLVKAPVSRYQGARLKYSKEEFMSISYCEEVKSEWITSKKC